MEDDQFIVPPIQPPLAGNGGGHAAVPVAVRPAGGVNSGVNLNGLVKQQLAEYDAQAAQAAKRQTELDSAQIHALEQREKTMHPMEEALSGLIDQKLPDRQQVEMPTPPKPTIDPKEYEGLSIGLLGLALVGGAVSKGNWMGVSSTLNGALKGYIDGNHEVAQREYDDYQRQFNAAKQHQQQIDEQFESVLNNRKMSINEQLQKIQLLAAQHGREDVLFAAKQKSIDGVVKQIDAGRNQLLGVIQRKEAVDERISSQKEQFRQRMGNASGASGSNNEAVESATWNGLINKKWPSSASPLYASVMHRVSEIAKENDMSTAQLISASADVNSRLMAKRSFEIRAQNIQRAENTLELEIPVLEDAMKAIDAPGLPIAARGKIAVMRSLGYPEITKLDQAAEVVLNEFEQIATGSPGSLNVQDVQQARHTYENIKTTQQMKAWVDGAKRIIRNAKAGQDKTRQETMRGVNEALGVKGLDHVTGAPKPYDAEKERRYQEWKKQHAGAQ